MAGEVDGISRQLDPTNGYEDEETRKEIEQNSSAEEKIALCPCLVVAIPQLPVGAMTELEVVAATRKAAACLRINDTFSTEEHEHGHILTSCVPITSPLGWDTGYDFELDPTSQERKIWQIYCHIRTLGSKAATFGLVAASMHSRPVQRFEHFLDSQSVLKDMMFALLTDTNFDAQHVLHLRLYYIATKRAFGGTKPQTNVATDDGIRLRLAFQTVVGSMFDDNSIPTTTCVPVTALHILNTTNSNIDLSPCLAIQAVSIDPIHLEQSIWIKYGR